MKSNAFRAGFLATLGGLIALVLGLAVSSIATVLVYLAAALFIGLGLDPIVRLIERRGLKRIWAISIVFAGFVVVLVGMLFLIVPVAITEGASLISSLPTSVSDLAGQSWFVSLNASLGGVIDLKAISASLGTFLSDPQNLLTLGGGLVKVGSTVIGGVFGTITIVILSLFFLGSLDASKNALYLMVPASRRGGVITISEQIISSVGKYTIGQVILAASNGVLGFIAMSIIGVPFAGVLAVIAFLLALIPLIGTIISAVLITLIALSASPWAALAVGIYFLVYMQVEAYYFSPKVMSRAVDVPGILVVIGALVGGTLLGVLGALVAVPVTAAILIIVKQVVIPRQQLA
ncbi:AI-2E family transporter [Subtercola sp. RTI3]|uniref:AI-2E family transporter n=1 Tax=Subtercola sp. RTI3 TaxID=3048639 RepID=UPI002B23C4CF|nr:AI-2E family transporter [Subtercola sp. RTI3]MEA9984168.1 AI-2E family transporter [Subtercola sp. RTI3]